MRSTLLNICLVFTVGFFVSCGSGNQSGEEENLVARGDRVYGGCLNVAENDYFQSMYPASVLDATSAFFCTQIHDGLVKLDLATLKVQPSIAESWTLNPEGTIYTFKLKKGAFFQDDPCFPGGKGREIKAADFKYAFELLCKKGPDNANFGTYFEDRLKGANAFYEGKGELSGVKVIDDYTLQLILERPSPVFLHILAQPVCAVVAKEAVEKYGAELKTGAGPFCFNEKTSSKDRIVLVRNKNYHGTDTLGNRLPFLDSVVVHIIQTKEQELVMFKDGRLDMISSLPSTSIKEMVEAQIRDFQAKPPKYLLDNSPEMITQYYTFNTRKPPFNKQKVRQAFCKAINRQKIIDEVLNGQAYGPGVKGITPPTFAADGYDINELSGYDYDPVGARKLLAEAGYPNGKGFPTIKVELNSGGAKNLNVVVEIQKQLQEELGINIDFDVVPNKQKLTDARNGNFDIVRDAWVADYPNPETFLGIFYGGDVPPAFEMPSFPNVSRYQSLEFDKYFLMGRHAVRRDSSMKYFQKAEKILIQDAPIMVLWYEGNYRLTHFYVKNAPTNPMRYRNYSQVFIRREAQSGEKNDTLVHN